MSYTSQATNNRSMNGIIEYDDGNGGLLSGGTITANTGEIGNLNVDFTTIGDLQVTDELQLGLGAFVDVLNGTQISDTEISYLDGTVSNIQNQINNLPIILKSANNTWTGTNTFNNTVNFNGAVNGLTKNTVGLGNVDNTSDLNKPVSTAAQNALNLKSNIASPTFTGIVTLPTTYNNAIQYFRNTGSTLPAITSQSFGAVSTNYSNGHAEVDFWNNYGDIGTTSAFRFYNVDNTTTPTPILLFNILRNGNTICYGNFNCAGGITLPSGQLFTFLGTITANSISITPVALSRIANLSSDCQAQLNNLQTQISSLPSSLLASNNTFTGTNSFNSTVTFSSTVNGLTKTTVGLSNIDNTSDVNKPVSTATQSALNSLQSQINSIPPVSTLLSSNNTWSGTNSFNSTVTFSSTVNGLTKTTVGLSNVDNTSDVNKPVSTATQTALNLKVNSFNGQHTGYTYFNNVGATALSNYGSGFFGAITTNLSGGNAELDFVNTGFFNTNPTAQAFNWYLATSSTTFSLLANLRNNGNFNIIGSFSSSGLTGTTASFTGLLSSLGATFTAAITGTTATFSGAISSVGATFTDAIFGTSGTFTGSLQAAFITITGLITASSLSATTISTTNLTVSSTCTLPNATIVNGNLTCSQGIISCRSRRSSTALLTGSLGVRYKWFDNAGSEANLPETIVMNSSSAGNGIIYLPDPNKKPDLPIDGAESREGIYVRIYFWITKGCQIYDGSSGPSNLHLPGTDADVYNFTGAKSQCLTFMVLRPNTSSVLQWCLLN